MLLLRDAAATWYVPNLQGRTRQMPGVQRRRHPELEPGRAYVEAAPRRAQAAEKGENQVKKSVKAWNYRKGSR